MAEAGLLLCAELGWVMDCHARLSARLCCSVVVVIDFPLDRLSFSPFCATVFPFVSDLCILPGAPSCISSCRVCDVQKRLFEKSERHAPRECGEWRPPPGPRRGPGRPGRENKPERDESERQHHKPQRHTRPASPARTGHRAGRCGAAATARDAHAAGHTDAEAGLLGTFLFFKAQPRATRHVQCATLCSPRCRFSASLSRRSATERQHSLRAPSHGD